METPQQWSAFCSGVRFEILSCLDGLGEASVAELAFSMDRSADGLYRHVKILLDAGLIEECDVRRVGRQSEAVYRMSAEHPVVDVDARSAAGRERMRDVARMVAREAIRSFEGALAAELCRNADDDRNTWVRCTQGWLDADDLVELRRMLDELDAFFATRQTRRPGALHTYSIMVNPVHRERAFDARGSHRQEEMLAEAETEAESPAD
jgi:DNA-binding transcriptional ArsR family regulator